MNEGRSRSAARRTFLPALVALLIALFVAPGAANAQGEATALSIAADGSEVWSATMSVGNNRGLLGYATLGERTVGALTTDSFSWRGRDYTVTNLIYNRSRSGADTWNVALDVWPPLPDGIECLTLRLGDQWLNLADATGNNRQFFWYGTELDWRFRDEIAVGFREFPSAFEPRSLNGRGNNRLDPELGMAHTKLLRRAGVSLSYGMSGDPAPALPAPRFVSNVLSVQTESMPNLTQVTDMVWQWGQFLDHDISLTPAATNPTETLRIAIPRSDPVFDPFGTGLRTMPLNRSSFLPGTGTGADNPREQVNTITAFIDASNVYGSDVRRARALRTNDGTGRLRTSAAGRLLPYNEDGIENDRGNSRQVLFLAGDLRANEQVGLTALHTLFVREHNRLAGLIASQNPDLSGQEIFELARKIVGAQMQVITFCEFLPLLLGSGAIEPYSGYDPTVDPTIANEFSTAAYRFGHTMLSSTLLLIDDTGTQEDVALSEAFFNPSLVADRGISGILRGLAAQQAQSVDARLVDEVRNLLFGAPGGPGRDLAALNIQRGRDHGLPDYNTVRAAYGLSPAATFADVSSDSQVQARLEHAYGELRRLDLWTGGLAEDPVAGGLLGETFRTILVEQFRRLRDGDRYWFENDPYFLANPDLLAEVRATTLADVIRRNTQVGEELPGNAFGGPLPAISIEAGPTGIHEGHEATFTLRRTGGTAVRLSVNVLIDETNAMLGEISNFTPLVTFEPGAYVARLSLPTHDDAILEVASTVSATITEAAGYQVSATEPSASLTIFDDDTVELELVAPWTLFEWPGVDGVPIGEALRNGGILDKVVSVYQLVAPGQELPAFFPSLDGNPGFNTLTTFTRGGTYWIAVTESVTWTVGGDGAVEPVSVAAAAP